MGFLRRDKEIISDLYYKVSTVDDSTFNYQRSKRAKKENKKEVKLSPGDWLTISNFKNLKFEERKFRNWFYLFYIKNISLFVLLFQISLLVIYAGSYSFAIFKISSNATSMIGAASFLNIMILFLPIIVLTFKAATTLTKTITNGGPSRSIHSKFAKYESITIKDNKGKSRTLFLDRDGNFVNDDTAEYHCGDIEKLNSNIFKFNLLILNKGDVPLNKVEYYTIQIDFEQKEGLQIPKTKKLQSHKVILNDYVIKKNKKKE